MASSTVSADGVLRGLHFAQLPPGQAKYVTCVKGAVFDVVVDIRVGSPTYGRWDSVRLDDVDRRSVYISEGLAHGFLALTDGATVMYLCSAPYAPRREHTIAATDPAFFQNRHPGGVVVLGQIICRRKAMTAAADHDEIIA